MTTDLPNTEVAPTPTSESRARLLAPFRAFRHFCGSLIVDWPVLWDLLIWLLVFAMCLGLLVRDCFCLIGLFVHHPILR